MNIHNIKPLPPYYVIKIGKVEQREKKEKEGSLYFPTAYAYMRRELQFGEIIAIGIEARDYFPEAAIGDMLLVHHFVSGKRTDKGFNFYIIHEDDDFNYYAVNAMEIPGERQLAYGIYSYGKFIPTPDHIFLEIPKEQSGIELRESGLYSVTERKKTRAEWQDIIKKNFNRIKSLSRNIPYDQREYDRANKSIMKGALDELKLLEAENKRITAMLSKKKYDLFKVLALNESWLVSLSGLMYGKTETLESICEGDEVYMLDIACQTIVQAFGKEFIVAETKYFGGSKRLLEYAVKHHNPSAASIAR